MRVMRMRRVRRVVGVRQRQVVVAVAAQAVGGQPPLDVHQQVLVVLLELAARVLELPHRRRLVSAARVRRVGRRVRHLVEPVHVQLPHKAGNVAVLEVPRQRVGKLLAREERKGVLLRGGGPPDQVRELGVAQHQVELVHKRILLDRRVARAFLTHVAGAPVCVVWQSSGAKGRWGVRVGGEEIGGCQFSRILLPMSIYRFAATCGVFFWSFFPFVSRLSVFLFYFIRI